MSEKLLKSSEFSPTTSKRQYSSILALSMDEDRDQREPLLAAKSPSTSNVPSLISSTPLLPTLMEDEELRPSLSFLLAQYSGYACKDEHLNEAIHVVVVEFLNGFATFFIVLFTLIRPFIDKEYGGYFYPAQLDRKNRVGINFYDLVLPLMLFCLGISISSTLRKKPGLIDYVSEISRTWFGLIFLALFVGNFKNLAETSTDYSFLLPLFAVITAACSYFVFHRTPFTESRFIVVLRPQFFRLEHCDEVLAILAANYSFISLWLIVSRDNVIYRIVPVGFVVAMNLAAPAADYWTFWAWEQVPIPHLFPMRHLQWLVVAIPATVVGDFFLENIDIIKTAAVPPIEAYSTFRMSYVGIATCLLVTITVTTTGMSPYFLSAKNTLIVGILIATMALFLRQFLRYIEVRSGESLSVFKKTIYWGLYHMILGWVLVPMRGDSHGVADVRYVGLTATVSDGGPEGLSAQPVSLSYLFFSSGFAILTFLFFFLLIILSVFSIKDSLLRYPCKFVYQLVMLMGYNSIMAISMTSWLVVPLLHLVHLNDSKIPAVATGMVVSLLLTFIFSYLRIRFYGQFTAENNIWTYQSKYRITLIRVDILVLMGGELHPERVPSLDGGFSLINLKKANILHRGLATTVYEIGQPQSLVIKASTKDLPTHTQRKRFRREVEIGNILNKGKCKNVVNYHGMHKLMCGHAVVMDAGHPESLESIAQEDRKRFTNDGFSAFYQLALNITHAVGEVHSLGVTHSALCPSHILVNPQLDVQLISFSSAFTLKRQNKVQLSAETELHYISPERTGRLLREVDFRSDFYSLGIIFYWMLVGHTPYIETDPSRIIYCHIAKVAPELHEVSSEIPVHLSRLISKLLAKSVDDRYQSIFGIVHDLQHCRDHLEDNSFVAGSRDARSEFRISKRLYGREKETNRLLDLFDRVSSGSLQRGLVWISGFSGMGKTALIEELKKPLVRDRGLLLSGKVDQFTRGVPYSSLVQAFRQFVRELLSGSDTQLEYWKERLNYSLGGKGAVICNLVPELEHILGPPPALPELAPTETQIRLKHVFIQFIKVFAQAEHPLVIFLDDLQWVDLPSLSLLEAVLLDTTVSHILVIGAYRDNEVDESHMLSNYKKKLEESFPAEEIVLGPLEKEHVHQMITDALCCTPSVSEGLSALAFAKSRGNPFFVNMLLTNLHRDGKIIFDAYAGRWSWNERAIAGVDISENVVELTTCRLKDLEPEVQRLLSLAAAIGNVFDIKMLALLAKQETRETVQKIWPALVDDLILLFGEDEVIIRSSEMLSSDVEEVQCQFLHDRVQQAAHELMNREEMESTHLTIAQILMEHTEQDKLDSQIFQIASHLLIARDLLKDQKEIIRGAGVFLRGAEHGKKSSAFQPSFDFADAGISILPENSWKIHYRLTLDLHKCRVEACYLKGDYDTAEKMYTEILNNVNQLEDKIAIYLIMITQYEIQQSTKECLNLCGLDLPQWTSADSLIEPMLQKELEKLKKNLNGREVSSLINLPENEDEISRLCLCLIVGLWAPIFCLGKSKLFKVNLVLLIEISSKIQLVCAMMTNMTMENGLSDWSSAAFAHFGFSCDDHTLAYQFGRLGCDVLELKPNELLKSRIYHSHGVGPSNFVMPLSEAYNTIDVSFESALDQGQVALACYSCHHMVSHRYHGGTLLNDVYQVYMRAKAYLNKTSAFVHQFLLGASMALLWHLEKEEFTPEEYKKNSDSVNADLAGYGRLQQLFWEMSSEWGEIYETIDFVLNHPDVTTGHWLAVEIVLYYRSFAEKYLETPEAISAGHASKKSIYDEHIQILTSQLTDIASSGSSNVGVKMIMIGAFRSLAEGNLMSHATQMEKARNAAAIAQLIQWEAFASEVLGRLWHAQDLPLNAQQYCRQANYLYSCWGSIFKAKQTRRIFRPYLRKSSDATSEHSSASDSAMEAAEDSPDLDAQVVMKLTQVVTSESSLDHLVDTMMRIIIENSGAQRGYFVLVQSSGELMVVAEGDTDKTQLGATDIDAHGSGKGQVNTIRAVALESSENFPRDIINYVARTKQMVLSNPVTGRKSPGASRSVLCVPVICNAELKGVVYLENDLVGEAFNDKKARIVSVVGTQMVVQLENAKFSQLLESERKQREIAGELVTFIDVLCHELRNPLNGIFGSKNILNIVVGSIDASSLKNPTPEVIQKLESDIEEIKEMTNSISVSADHLKEIVDSVLTVSMLDKQQQQMTLDKQTFDLREVLNKAMEKDIFIQLDIPEEDQNCVVTGDSHRISQILINLLSNCLKFTHQGGVTISMKLEDRGTDQVAVHFCVKDTGIGLTEQEIGRLFKPFSQANETTYSMYGGSGLGLKISQEIAHTMGGDIRVESDYGVGSSFIFHVLCGKSTKEAAINWRKRKIDCVDELSGTNARDSELHKRTKRGGKILVVEDNNINQKLMKKILEMEGYMVEVASNGKEALDMVVNFYEKERKQYMTVFMDMEMPIMNGLISTKAIRDFEQSVAIARPVKIIGVSANARDTYSLQAIHCGMNNYITKPFQRQDIISSIEETPYV
ncbi:ATP-binding protein [Planoprotostelium fungivorum]|uniref:ATP-binding protein n=1 Tax=Planoprotostelium fungivorum TaxID=1890364 RepID=A0A2P6MZI5_9EUKA|nr:ATP-binding protein [Planoprotostelium fungivorum]